MALGNNFVLGVIFIIFLEIYGTKGDEIEMDLCCNVPAFIPEHILNECNVTESTLAEKAPADKNKKLEFYHTQLCEATCVAKKQNILKNEVIDDGLVAEYVKKLCSKDAEAKKFYDDVLKQCNYVDVAKHVKDSNLEEIETTKNGETCKAINLMYTMCIGKHFILECPKDKVIKSKECDELREVMKIMPQ